jgi:hypothetical protein
VPPVPNRVSQGAKGPQWPLKTPTGSRSRKLAHKASDPELLGKRKALQLSRDRLRKRISDLRIEVDALRSVLSGLKAEMEATR